MERGSVGSQAAGQRETANGPGEIGAAVTEESEVFVPVPPAGRVRWRVSLAALAVTVIGAGFGVYGIVTALPSTTPVLVVRRPVPIGQLITTADVRVVEMSLAAGVEVVTSSQADSVWGRPAAVPLLPGALLSPRQVGARLLPVAGQVLVAVPVAVVPAGVGAGSQVQVVTRVASRGGERLPVTWPATVVEIEPDTIGDGCVVTLQLPMASGIELASVAMDGHTSLLVDSGLPDE